MPLKTSKQAQKQIHIHKIQASLQSSRNNIGTDTDMLINGIKSKPHN